MEAADSGSLSLSRRVSAVRTRVPPVTLRPHATPPGAREIPMQVPARCGASPGGWASYSESGHHHRCCCRHRRRHRRRKGICWHHHHRRRRQEGICWHHRRHRPHRALHHRHRRRRHLVSSPTSHQRCQFRGFHRPKVLCRLPSNLQLRLPQPPSRWPLCPPPCARPLCLRPARPPCTRLARPHCSRHFRSQFRTRHFRSLRTRPARPLCSRHFRNRHHRL
mmetsp:Transcript_23669/g.59053  ORF Transcript_23669/g.59053 Transcript_23669/m.59053 type:complete len:221 (-) Transcript_23669:39-701(-)